MTETTTAPASVAATLRAAKALIDTPEKWTKGAMARRTQFPTRTNADDPDATVFCMVGAVRRVDGLYEMDALHALSRAVGGGESVSIVKFNDARGRKHVEVMEAFDKAIALAESKS